MFEIDWTRCATTPRDHQKLGVRTLLRRDDPADGRVIPDVFLLGDEVGAGKSKQGIDTAQILYEAGVIDTVVVECPAAARGVWANPDPELGEVAKHGWPSITNTIIEYSVRFGDKPLRKTYGRDKGLLWLVTNYEFIRRDERLGPLLSFLANRRYWLICDEAWALKDCGTDQWKATHKIRRMAARVTLLNGTPVTEDPLDLFAQMKMLDVRILGFKYFSHFRNYYAEMKPNVSFPMITGWKNLEELREKVRPYVLHRKTRDCFDLPPVLDPVLIEAKLTDDNWRIYKGMRDEMVSWLELKPEENIGTASIARQAIVKAMRLAQITSGYVGGVQDVDMSEGDFLDFSDGKFEDVATFKDDHPVIAPTVVVREIGTEKLDALIAWLERLWPVPNRILVWCRFRLEVERTASRLAADTHWKRMHLLYGSQSQAERDAAIAALNPGILPSEPTGVVGNPNAGGAGVNLAGASLAATLSHDTKLRVYLQARGRIDRPGQTQPIRYVDVVATGPKGQRTIDHHILAALRGKQDIARWTTATWRSKLLEE
jgi:hypothetical protein